MRARIIALHGGCTRVQAEASGPRYATSVLLMVDLSLRDFMPSDAYNEAIDRAALMLLAALRDHVKPQFSSVQLEALRRRGGLLDSAQAVGERNVRVVFADIRERAVAMLAAELKRSGAAADVAAEMDRVLHRLLTTVEQAFGGH